jgi:hypothetical protein
MIAVSCNDENENNRSQKSQKINLFTDNNDDANLSSKPTKLSYEQALRQCNIALVSPEITLIDSSDSSRSKTVIFIYKANNGRLIKAAKGATIHAPVYFVTHQKLTKSTNNNDSVTIFLKEIKDYKWIHKYLFVNYRWLDNAPY